MAMEIELKLLVNLQDVDTLSALQDEISWLNDAAVAGRLLEELLDKQVHLEGSIGFIRGYFASHIENDDKQIHKLWKNFCVNKTLLLTHSVMPYFGQYFRQYVCMLSKIIFITWTNQEAGLQPSLFISSIKNRNSAYVFFGDG